MARTGWPAGVDEYVVQILLNITHQLLDPRRDAEGADVRGSIAHDRAMTRPHGADDVLLEKRNRFGQTKRLRRHGVPSLGFKHLHIVRAQIRTTPSVMRQHRALGIVPFLVEEVRVWRRDTGPALAKATILEHHDVSIQWAVGVQEIVPIPNDCTLAGTAQCPQVMARVLGNEVAEAFEKCDQLSALEPRTLVASKRGVGTRGVQHVEQLVRRPDAGREVLKEKTLTAAWTDAETLDTLAGRPFAHKSVRVMEGLPPAVDEMLQLVGHVGPEPQQELRPLGIGLALLYLAIPSRIIGHTVMNSAMPLMIQRGILNT